MDKESVPLESQVALWAKNVNGWYCGVGNHFEIQPITVNAIANMAANPADTGVRQASATGGPESPTFR